MSPGPQQFALDIIQAPAPSLGNFIVPEKGTKDNFSLIDALKKISNCWQAKQSIPQELSWVYFWGEVGSGRTHLLKAMMSQASQSGLKTTYLAPNDSQAWKEIAESFDQLPQLILIDDVHALNEIQQSILFRIQIEARTNPQIVLLITGETSVAGLKLRTDVQSRIGWGLSFEIASLSDPEKIQAINQAAQERGIYLASDVAPWLLSNFHRDLPSLLSLIEALDHFSLEKKRAITLPLLREFLQSPSV